MPLSIKKIYSFHTYDDLPIYKCDNFYITLNPTVCLYVVDFCCLNISVFLFV